MTEVSSSNLHGIYKKVSVTLILTKVMMNLRYNGMVSLQSNAYSVVRGTLSDASTSKTETITANKYMHVKLSHSRLVVAT